MRYKSLVQFCAFIFLTILFSTTALTEERHLSIDQAGWEKILKTQKNFTTSELINKSTDLINEAMVAESKGEIESSLYRVLAALIISRHIENITKVSDDNQKISSATIQLEEYLYKSGFNKESISNSYSTFLEYSNTAGINIKHYTIDDIASSSIPPDRLHWPNTVIKHYDSQGRLRGYSVIPTRRR